MKLSQLQHLVAIVKFGSLRAAARELDTPQPVLTRNIRMLEKELGGALFVRESKGMVLSSIGRLFHARASLIVNESQRAMDEVAQSLGEEHGAVAIALSIMPHIAMLPRALPQFRARYPNVRIQIIEGLFPDAEQALRDGVIDFYLGAAPKSAVMPGLNSELILENTRAVVARKGHPLSQATSFRQLAQAEWATTAVDYDAAHDLEQVYESYSLPRPRIVLNAKSALSMMVAISSSDLLAMLPMQWNDFTLTRDALEVIPLQERFPAPSIVMVKRTGLPLTPAAEFFADVLLRQVP